jgi:cation/acetate symporter
VRLQAERLQCPALSIAEIDSNPELAWIRNWEKTGLLAFNDKNGDGLIQYFNEPAALVAANKAWLMQRKALADAPADADKAPLEQAVADATVARDAVLADEALAATLGGQTLAEQGLVGNELTTVNNDIMVLANPEIAKLPGWVIALVAAGGLAAALSTAAGLLLAISSAISHDLIKGASSPISAKRANSGRADLDGLCDRAGHLAWSGPARLCRAGGGSGLRSGGCDDLPGADDGDLLHQGHQGRRDRRHDRRSDLDVGLHLPLPGLVLHPRHEHVPEHAGAHWLGISPAAFGPVGALLNFVVAYVVSR